MNQTFAIYREGRYMPIGTVQAETHEQALVLAEAMWGGPLLVTTTLGQTMAELGADMRDKDIVGLANIMRAVRKAP